MKEINNFEGLYEVSNTGKVRSCDRYISYKDNKIKIYFVLTIKEN